MTDNVSEHDGVSYPPWNIQNIKDYSQYAVDQKMGAIPKIHIIKTNQHSAGKFIA